MMKNKNSFTVIILCGGLATRLKYITKQIPKSLVLINDKCFIDYQFDYLNTFNINNCFIYKNYSFSVLTIGSCLSIHLRYSV